MWNRFLFWYLAAAVTTSTLVLAEGRRPNFVVIMADDLGYGDLSSYGSRRWQTPHIDRLAREGMRFLDFHSNGAVCSPTRAALLTGRYQQRSGVDLVISSAKRKNRHHGLHASEVTFAELLKEQGYATGIFGKWHLGYEERFNPIHHGFDSFYGYTSGNVDYFRHIDPAGLFDWWHQTSSLRETGYTTHLIGQHAVDFIRENRGQPFCVYIAHETPHEPYQGPEDLPIRNEGSSKFIWNHKEPTHAVEAYGRMMAEMDKSVGKVTQALEDLNLASDTLVLFFSDNGATGPGSNGQLYGKKGTLWEGGHRVPAVAWWPGTIRQGTVSRDLAMTMDILPTLIELGGGRCPAGHSLDGVSLAEVLLHESRLDKRQLFWEYRDAQAMRDGEWKLVLNGGKAQSEWNQFHNWKGGQDERETVALFNLGDSISEVGNLAKKYPERVEDMRKTLAEWKVEVVTNATVQPSKRPK